MGPKQKLEGSAEQQPDRYRYHITNEALLKGTCPQMENANHLRAAELSTEQNMNMIDGIPNNKPPRVNQGYTILESEVVGHMEYVLAENQKAPQPYVTWARNIQNDEQSGGEDFFWGHYFCDPEAARKDLYARADEQRDHIRESRPSLLGMLRQDKENAARSIQEPPAMDHVKRGLER